MSKLFSLKSLFVSLLLGAFVFLTSCQCPDFMYAAPVKISGNPNKTTREVMKATDFLLKTFADTFINALIGCRDGDRNCIENAKKNANIYIPNYDSADKRDKRVGLVGKRIFQTGIVYQVYNGIISSYNYRAIYYLSVVLYILILGITYLMGMSQMTIDKLLPTIFKLGVITLFTNPSISGSTGFPIGWEFYQNFIVSPALYTMEAFAVYFIAALLNWDESYLNTAFTPLTMMLPLIIEKDFWIRLTAILFTHPLLGIPTIMLMLTCVISFTLTILYSFITYLTTIVMLSLLFSLGPFFLLSFLFEKTKNFGKRWMNNIISLMIQQYMLFTAIAIFGFIIVQGLEAMLSFNLKCSTIIAFNIQIPLPDFIVKMIAFFGGTAKYLIDESWPLMKWITIATPNPASGLLTLAMYSIFLYAMVKIFQTTITNIVNIASGLVEGTMSAANTKVAQGASQLVTGATDGVSGLASKAALAPLNKVGNKVGYAVTHPAKSVNKVKNAPENIAKSAKNAPENIAKSAKNGVKKIQKLPSNIAKLAKQKMQKIRDIPSDIQKAFTGKARKVRKIPSKIQNAFTGKSHNKGKPKDK